jgi:hypothetical protein
VEEAALPGVLGEEGLLQRVEHAPPVEGLKVKKPGSL